MLYYLSENCQTVKNRSSPFTPFPTLYPFFHTKMKREKQGVAKVFVPFHLLVVVPFDGGEHEYVLDQVLTARTELVVLKIVALYFLFFPGVRKKLQLRSATQNKF